MDRNVQGCLFDMDGLLLDTEIIYTEVTQSIVSRFGRVFDWSIKGNMIGRPSRDAAGYLVSALDLPITAEQYIEEREVLLRQKFVDCKALSGAERLIRHLDANNIPMAVATSSNRDLYALKTMNHMNWFRLFNTVVTGDDPEIINGKPAPDIFLVAAKRLAIESSAALVFEDAPSGLQAGLDAGMQVITIPDKNMDKKRYLEATRVLDSLEQFVPSDFGLPDYH
jgi:pseudouridine-5'-monophosphatase